MCKKFTSRVSLNSFSVLFSLVKLGNSSMKTNIHMKYFPLVADSQFTAEGFAHLRVKTSNILQALQQRRVFTVCHTNERLSLQGSVEAQCGLVLNGQGGVIRRGKGPPFISSLCCCTGGRGKQSRLDTRQDSEQTDKQAERSSLVCCQHVTAGTAPLFSPV